MRLVVADTSPIFYLFSIDLIDVLPKVFGNVFIPEAVHGELRHPAAPSAIREWALHPPLWMEVRAVSETTLGASDTVMQSLGIGERAAISLAEVLHADLILIDERKGTNAALTKGFDVTGTLGVLDLAARRGLIDLTDAFARLKATNFRYPPEIMDALLKQRKL